MYSYQRLRRTLGLAAVPMSPFLLASLCFALCPAGPAAAQQYAVVDLTRLGFSAASVGDGQQALLDGLFTFNNHQIPAADSVQHFKSINGTYWDTTAFDMSDRLGPGEREAVWSHELRGDCLVFAFSMLEVHAAAGEDDPKGSAGQSSGGSSSGGNGGRSANPNGGRGGSASTAGGVGGDVQEGGAPTAQGTAQVNDDSGCGCRLTPNSTAGSGFAAALLAFAGLLRRRRD